MMRIKRRILYTSLYMLVLIFLISVLTNKRKYKIVSQVVIDSFYGVESHDDNEENMLCQRTYLNESIAELEARKYITDSYEYTKKIKKFVCKPRKTGNIISYQDLLLFNSNNNLNKTVIELLRSYGLVIDTDSMNSSIEYFLFTLNVTNLESFTKKPAKDTVCVLSRFDKTYNVSEHGQKIDYYEAIKFDLMKNYQIAVNKSGFYYVNCTFNSSIVYNDVFRVLPFKMNSLIKERQEYKFTVNDFRRYAEPMSRWGRMPIVNPMKIDKKMNVLVLAFDSLSYKHFYRVFPQTAQFLDGGTEGSIIYSNAHSVGVNTYPNIVPLLSGISCEESKELDLKKEITEYLKMDDLFHDQIPFIWNDYEHEGYLTMLQQDQPSYSSFNYIKKGFRGRPTSIYTRGFWSKYYNLKKDSLCFNGVPLYDTYFDLIEQFVDRMNVNEDNKNVPYFAFNFLTDYTHDDVYVPKRLDVRLKNMLKKFETNGYLDNTLLIVMGDHGNRLSRFGVYSTVGKAEKYRPYLAIKLPKSMWGTKFAKIANKNKNRLISMYDLYQTLRHFLKLNKEYINENEHNLNIHQIRHLRGISIFEDIPVNRSCHDALIPLQKCSCGIDRYYNISEFSNDTNVSYKEISSLLLKLVILKTKPFRTLCAVYRFDKFITIKKKLYNNYAFYFIEFMLQPGKAIFNAVMKISKSNNTNYNKVNYELFDNIVRTSRYGNQSECINDFEIKNYCFCKRIDLTKN